MLDISIIALMVLVLETVDSDEFSEFSVPGCDPAVFEQDVLKNPAS